MANDGTIAEKFVADHCSATFLSLWGAANPIGKNSSKELCDFIVVCEPDIIIISVKDIRLPARPTHVASKRWHRAAIEESVKAIYGAQRHLTNRAEVTTKSGRTLKLPPQDERCIHRICVAFGGRGEIPIRMGDFGKGFVHVLDEVSFPILLRELDSIEDFVKYLTAKEGLLRSKRKVIFAGEEDLLGLFLQNGGTFAGEHDLIFIEGDIWDGIARNSLYLEKKEADRTSYAWDNLIEYISKDLLAKNLLFVDPAGEAERALRILARENRFHRRFLAESMTEVLQSRDIRARMVQSYSGVVYVFAAFPRDEDRDYRIAELTARCYVARSRFKDESCVVVGIASERANDQKKGLSFDLLLLDVPVWTSDLEERAETAREELGFFKKPRMTSRRVDEYPREGS
jgi:hypothetical protein